MDWIKCEKDWFPLHTDFLGQHVDERQSCLSELAHRGLKGWTRTCAIDRSTGLQMNMGQKLVSQRKVVSAKIIAGFSNRWAFGPSRAQQPPLQNSDLRTTKTTATKVKPLPRAQVCALRVAAGGGGGEEKYRREAGSICKILGRYFPIV